MPGAVGDQVVTAVQQIFRSGFMLKKGPDFSAKSSHLAGAILTTKYQSHKIVMICRVWFKSLRSGFHTYNVTEEIIKLHK